MVIMVNVSNNPKETIAPIFSTPHLFGKYILKKKQHANHEHHQEVNVTREPAEEQSRTIKGRNLASPSSSIPMAIRALAFYSQSVG